MRDVREKVEKDWAEKELDLMTKLLSERARTKRELKGIHDIILDLRHRIDGLLHDTGDCARHIKVIDSVFAEVRDRKNRLVGLGEWDMKALLKIKRKSLYFRRNGEWELRETPLCESKLLDSLNKRREKERRWQREYEEME